MLKQGPNPPSPQGIISPALCNQSEAEEYARRLLSGYPSARPPDPEYYIANVVALFAQYEKSLVEKAVSCTGIPSKHPSFPPTVGEIGNWIKAEKTARDRLASVKPIQLTRPSHKPLEPNLFVSKGADGFDAMLARAQAEPASARVVNEHTLCTGELTAGVWVPLEWWPRPLKFKERF